MSLSDEVVQVGVMADSVDANSGADVACHGEGGSRVKRVEDQGEVGSGGQRTLYNWRS